MKIRNLILFLYFIQIFANEKENVGWYIFLFVQLKDLFCRKKNHFCNEDWLLLLSINSGKVILLGFIFCNK